MSKDEYQHLLEYLDDKFTSIDSRFDHLESRVGNLGNVADNLSKQFITFGEELTILIQ